jgi:large subunit ribosomal protein L25
LVSSLLFPLLPLLLFQKSGIDERPIADSLSHSFRAADRSKYWQKQFNKMKSVPLKAYPRTQTRHGQVKQLRATGRIPAVIYGRETKPQNLELNAREIGDLISHSVSENLLVDLSVENDSRAKRLALVQEIQHHPIDGKVLHVDFHEVSETEKVTVQVPVETVGEAAGVKNGGGVLEHVLFKLRVRSLPKDLPEQLIIDVTALEIGKSIHLGEIKAPEGVEILGDKKITVVSVAQPRAEEEPTAVETKAASDVEMTKEKKDEEGAEGAAPAKAEAKAADKGADKKAEAKPEAKAPEKKK